MERTIKYAVRYMYISCLLFVLIRHGEGGTTSLHAGLERWGKETGEPTGTFGSHPPQSTVFAWR